MLLEQPEESVRIDHFELQLRVFLAKGFHAPEHLTRTGPDDLPLPGTNTQRQRSMQQPAVFGWYDLQCRGVLQSPHTVAGGFVSAAA